MLVQVVTLMSNAVLNLWACGLRCIPDLKLRPSYTPPPGIGYLLYLYLIMGLAAYPILYQCTRAYLTAIIAMIIVTIQHLIVVLISPRAKNL